MRGETPLGVGIVNGEPEAAGADIQAQLYRGQIRAGGKDNEPGLRCWIQALIKRRREKRREWWMFLWKLWP
ncbi:hypothetical protein AMELA_G00161810 [Ameiurus melas]|uniref:Uncharacterized protein n=1 Tax=Ameiurus melas TaxID=219545 RepID=A0A7J6AHG9_AMEME|nr:hypothetical protein AMELA_G00161810 [Ameiurus melas]